MSEQPTPGWRWLVVDKKHTMIITRAANPLIYWITIAVSGALGALALRKAWQQLRS